MPEAQKQIGAVEKPYRRVQAAFRDFSKRYVDYRQQIRHVRRGYRKGGYDDYSRNGEPYGDVRRPSRAP